MVFGIMIRFLAKQITLKIRNSQIFWQQRLYFIVIILRLSAMYSWVDLHVICNIQAPLWSAPVIHCGLNHEISLEWLAPFVVQV